MNHQPIGWYYRQALQQDLCKADLRNIAHYLLAQVEQDREFIRKKGCWPGFDIDPIHLLSPVIPGFEKLERYDPDAYDEARAVTDAFTAEPVNPKRPSRRCRLKLIYDDEAAKAKEVSA